MAQANKEPRISWEIEEYNHREKGPDWFWALGVIAIASAAIAVIFHDTLFAIFIILAAIVLGFYAARRPEVIDIAISDQGIRIRNFFYAFEKIKGFSIDEHDLGNHLIIETSRIVAPVISIALPYTIDPETLRQLLLTRLTEKNFKEQLTHRVMEHLGF